MVGIYRNEALQMALATQPGLPSIVQRLLEQTAPSVVVDAYRGAQDFEPLLDPARSIAAHWFRPAILVAAGQGSIPPFIDDKALVHPDLSLRKLQGVLQGLSPEVRIQVLMTVESLNGFWKRLADLDPRTILSLYEGALFCDDSPRHRHLAHWLVRGLLHRLTTATKLPSSLPTLLMVVPDAEWSSLTGERFPLPVIPLSSVDGGLCLDKLSLRFLPDGIEVDGSGVTDFMRLLPQGALVVYGPGGLGPELRTVVAGHDARVKATGRKDLSYVVLSGVDGSPSGDSPSVLWGGGIDQGEVTALGALFAGTPSFERRRFGGGTVLHFPGSPSEGISTVNVSSHPNIVKAQLMAHHYAAFMRFLGLDPIQHHGDLATILAKTENVPLDVARELLADPGFQGTLMPGPFSVDPTRQGLVSLLQQLQPLRQVLPATVVTAMDDLAVGHFSYIGDRPTQQDLAFYTRRGLPQGLDELALMADGHGNQGGLASQRAITNFYRLLPSHFRPGKGLRQGLTQLVREVDLSLDGLEGGTTLTAWLRMGRKAVVVHVGDSRLYRIGPSGPAEQLTRDHHWGRVRYRYNIMMSRVLGDWDVKRASEGEHFQVTGRPDIRVVRVHRGGRFLLCSDGASILPDDQIAAAMNGRSPQVAANTLVLEAVRAWRSAIEIWRSQGHPDEETDNITALVLG